MPQLTIKRIDKLRKEGKSGNFADGNNLYLHVSPNGATSWVFRYQFAGVRHDMGIGSYPRVPLLVARAKAVKLLQQLDDDIDPLKERTQARQEQAIAAAAASITFRACAEQYIAGKRAEWRKPEAWSNMLSRHVYPLLGEILVDRITTENVLRVLRPIWNDKTKTASSVREKIEVIIAYASASGYRGHNAPNPARWRGHLEFQLAKPSVLLSQAEQHRESLPYSATPGFVAKLRAQSGTTHMAIELAVLTALRSNEVCGAPWDEIDLDSATWTIPAARMKAKVAHTVPLSPQAVALLRRIPRTDSEFVFPNRKGGTIHTSLLIKAARKIEPAAGFTIHGFRSSLSKWASEQTGFAPEIIEMSLAHRVGKAVENAYRRSDLRDRRRQLMIAWANYLDGKAVPTGEVVPIHAEGREV